MVRCVSYLHVLRSAPKDNHALKAARHAKVITRGGIGSLVSLVNICEEYFTSHDLGHTL